MAIEMGGYSEKLGLTVNEILTLQVMNMLSAYSRKIHGLGEEDKDLDRNTEEFANSPEYRNALDKIHAAKGIETGSEID